MTVTSDVTVTAVFEADIVIPDESFIVKFIDWDGTVLKSETVKSGESATAPADPVREGYVFTGWDTDFSNVTKDLDVLATYKEVEEQGLNDVQSDKVQSTKLLRDGQLIIIRGDKMYNIIGAELR